MGAASKFGSPLIAQVLHKPTKHELTEEAGVKAPDSSVHEVKKAEPQLGGRNCVASYLQHPYRLGPLKGCRIRLL